MSKILVVEDDLLLNRMLTYNLAADHFEVKSADSIFSAQALLKGEEFDLIVLDVNLPDGSGFDLCRQLRGESQKALIVFLTANDMESDMVRGFELGADDYVTKPFPISVFQRKVGALLKRAGSQEQRDCYEDGHLRIDFSGLTAKLGEQKLELTPLEFRALKILTENPGRILTRQVLLDRLWDADGNFVDEHTLTSAISRIRGKISSEARPYIKTVYGMGYLWIGGEKT